MDNEQSPLAGALALVGDRWTLQIVDALLAGPLRFNDVQEKVSGIAPNVLSARLRTLEREGLVVAEPYQSRPPRFEYRLSAGGQELVGALRLLAHWGAGHGGGAEPPRHDVCGTPLEVRWYCPTCSRTVEGPDDAGMRFA